MKSNQQYVNAKELGRAAFILSMIAIAWNSICSVVITVLIFFAGRF